jgi:hypothetical protein
VVDTVVVRSACPERYSIFTTRKPCDIFAEHDDSRWKFGPVNSMSWVDSRLRGGSSGAHVGNLPLEAS